MKVMGAAIVHGAENVTGRRSPRPPGHGYVPGAVLGSERRPAAGDAARVLSRVASMPPVRFERPSRGLVTANSAAAGRVSHPKLTVMSPDLLWDRSFNTQGSLGTPTMTRLMFVMSVSFSLFLGGCAAVSRRSLTSGASPVSAGDGLEGMISAQPLRLFQGEPIDVMFLVHLEYERPPYMLTLRVKDTQNHFEALDVRLVRIRYQGEPERTVTPSQRVTRFEDEYDCREATVRAWDALPSHASVEVIITADAIQPNGKRVPVEFRETLSPSSMDWMGNWFSWAASA